MGLIAGIIIGLIILTLVVGIVGFLVWRYKQRAKAVDDDEATELGERHVRFRATYMPKRPESDALLLGGGREPEDSPVKSERVVTTTTEVVTPNRMPAGSRATSTPGSIGTDKILATVHGPFGSGSPQEERVNGGESY